MPDGASVFFQRVVFQIIAKAMTDYYGKPFSNGNESMGLQSGIVKTVIWSIVSVILLILRIAIVVVGSISGAYLSISGFFGVYGMLVISLLLFSVRHITYLYDVLWNHSLCKLKDIVESCP